MIPNPPGVGIPSIQYIGTAGATATAIDFSTVAIQRGDLLIRLNRNGASGTNSTPDGWSQIWGYATGDGAGGRHYGWWKLAASSSETDPTLDNIGGRNRLFVYRGGIYAAGSAQTYSATVSETTLTVPAISTGIVGAWCACAIFVKGDQTGGWDATSAPTGVTIRNVLNTTPPGFQADTNGPSAGWAQKDSAIASSGVVHAASYVIRPLLASDL